MAPQVSPAFIHSSSQIPSQFGLLFTKLAAVKQELAVCAGKPTGTNVNNTFFPNTQILARSKVENKTAGEEIQSSTLTCHQFGSSLLTI